MGHVRARGPLEPGLREEGVFSYQARSPRDGGADQGTSLGPASPLTVVVSPQNTEALPTELTQLLGLLTLPPSTFLPSL